MVGSMVNSMQVEIKLFASLRKYKQDSSEILVECDDNTTVEELLTKIGVPLEETPIILVNGIRVNHSHTLNDGETISAFPLIGGG
jgi:molybdopterin synthase sulfur carrier subunit